MVWAIAIAWSAREPSRVGEIAVLACSGTPLILGRADHVDASESRVRFFRQGPGSIELRPPVQSPTLSRRQLVLRPREQCVDFERVGKSLVRVNGADCDSGSLRSGDVVYIRNELLLMVLQRPAVVPTLRHFNRAHHPTFGDADQLEWSGNRRQRGGCAKTWRSRRKPIRTPSFWARAGRAKSSSPGRSTRSQLDWGEPSSLATRRRCLPESSMPSSLATCAIIPIPGCQPPGLVGEAHGGTLFLDEIAELSQDLQARLLRVLDSGGEYHRLGEGASRRSDFRLIGATNRDVSAIKHDVLARFAVRIAVPNLADRVEDIPLLLRTIAIRAATKSPDLFARFIARDEGGRPYAQLAPSLVEHAVRTSVQGNVRGLEGLLWQSVAESCGEALTVPAAVRASHEPDATSSPPPAASEPTAEDLRLALKREEGSVSRAARALGMSSRYAMYRLLRKHGIELDGDTDS